MASKKSAKAKINAFKRLPNWAKVVIIIMIIAILCATVYMAVVQPQFIKDLFNVGQQDGDGVLMDGELKIHFLDVGQGDCILILFPDGKEMLIDCANYNGGNAYKTKIMTYLSTYITDGQIDYLMLTHCDSDHVYFLDDVIDAYDVDNIYMPNVLAVPDATKASNAEKITAINNLDSAKKAWFTDPDVIETGLYADFFISALNEVGANVKLNIGNFSISGEGYKIDFYAYTAEEWAATDLSSAEEKNAISPIGVLQYNGKKVLLTGDSNEINEEKFIQKIGGSELDCDVLKVGHHGSQTSSTAEFLDFVKCEYAVISCNASGNTFKHPRQATLDRFTARKRLSTAPI